MSKEFEASIPAHEITPEWVFMNRRRFLSTLGIGLATGPCLLAAPEGEADLLTPPYESDVFPASRNQAFAVPEAVERKELTPREVAAAHNNFYEFLPEESKRPTFH